MRIEFERSGGVAGMRLSLSIDTDTLPEEEADAIEDLVDRSDFFALSEQTEAVSTPDAFTYRVTVEAEGRRHTVTTTDIGAPASLTPLLERLESRARRTRKE